MVLLYAFLAGLTAASALLVLLTPHMLYAALGLLCTLLGMAAIYFLQGASFVAVAYVIVYGSGVVVIIFCSALLLPLYTKTTNQHPRWLLKTLITIGLAGGVLWPWVSSLGYSLQQKEVADLLQEDVVAGLGLQLLGPYALAFEWVGLSLLIALVGALHIMQESQC